MGPTESASLCLLLELLQVPVDRIDISVGAHLSRFHLKKKTEFNPRNVVYLNKKTGRWIMSRIVIVVLTYRCHKPIDSINLLGS
jgi:hypothetical protein